MPHARRGTAAGGPGSRPPPRCRAGAGATPTCGRTRTGTPCPARCRRAGRRWCENLSSCGKPMTFWANHTQTVLDQQPDAVQHHEHDALTGRALALAVPERPVPVADEGHDRGDQRGERVRGEQAEAEREAQQVEPDLGDDEADPTDDEELGALVDQQPEPLVQGVDKIHLAAFPSPYPLRTRRGDYARVPGTSAQVCETGRNQDAAHTCSCPGLARIFVRTERM